MNPVLRLAVSDRTIKATDFKLLAVLIDIGAAERPVTVPQYRLSRLANIDGKTTAGGLSRLAARGYVVIARTRPNEAGTYRVPA